MYDREFYCCPLYWHYIDGELSSPSAIPEDILTKASPGDEIWFTPSGTSVTSKIQEAKPVRRFSRVDSGWKSTGVQTMDNTIDRQISLISEILNAHDEDTLLGFEDEVDWVLNGAFCGEYLIATRDTFLSNKMEKFGVLHLVNELLRSLDKALG